MARYLMESRQKRQDREAREERRKGQREGLRPRKGRLVIQLRRPQSDEQFEISPSSSSSSSTSTSPTSCSPPRAIDGERSRSDPDLAARRARLIAKHQLRSLDPDEDERFYVVEKLIDKRVDQRGVEEYKVRWENYPPDADSWEPRSELEKNALDMINAFNNIAQPANDDSIRHCICRMTYSPGEGAMIQCSTCGVWYHFSCLNLNLYEANCYANYHCSACRERNPQLKCVIKQNKLNRLQGLTSMRVDKTNGVILESPPKKAKTSG